MLPSDTSRRIADHWPTHSAEISAFIGEMYTVERLVSRPVSGDAAAEGVRWQLRQERSPLVVERIWQWATVQVGLPRSDFGKVVRYMLERWAGPTRFVNPAAIARPGAVTNPENLLNARLLS
jgi:hypothetical protein